MIPVPTPSSMTFCIININLCFKLPFPVILYLGNRKYQYVAKQESDLRNGFYIYWNIITIVSFHGNLTYQNNITSKK